MPAKLSLNDAILVAKQRESSCLSQVYLNCDTRMEWQCKSGHTWKNTLYNIRKGQWCPYCAHRAPLTIQEMQKLAHAKGGECLSEKYENEVTKLIWKCADGHVWSSIPKSIKKGVWCPICSKSGVNERICRATLERIFGQEFPKIRPKWLLSPKNKLMELDGYCEKLKIAFEYHGQQHYDTVPHFHREKSLAQQKQYDELKKNLCLANKIILLEIPYQIKPDYIPPYIVSQLVLSNIKLPANINPVVLEDMKKEVASPHRLKEMQKLAKKRNGKCLSAHYLTSDNKLLWRCYLEHEFLSSPNDVQQGKWCRKCGIIKTSNIRRLTIEEMQKIAETRHGKCLSKQYKNNRTPLLWECKKGHEWNASTDNIKAGKWCIKCQRYSVEDMQNLAKLREGKCLSEEYRNDTTKLLWKCKEGHEWNAVFSNVRRGTWCPQCFRNRITQQKMKKAEHEYEKRTGTHA